MSVQADNPDSGADQFADWCLEALRSLLAPGSALRREAELVAHREVLSLELDRSAGTAVLARLAERDGSHHTERFELAPYVPTQPGHRTREEAHQVALEIAANISEP